MAERGRHRKENTRERSRSRGRTKKEDALAPSTADALSDPEQNWAAKTDSPAFEAASKLYKLILKGFDNKSEQTQAIEEYWNVYNCQPDDNQQYTGNAQGYIPAVRDGINARAKRALKQLFPSNHKHVDGLASDGHAPNTQLALLEHYIRTTNLRSIVRTDLVAGDVTGQWNLMLDWTTSVRKITQLVRRNPLLEQIDGEERAELELPGLDSEEEDTEDEDVLEEGPEIVDFATEDLCVLPPTCNNLQKAHAVTLKLRLSKEAVERMVDQGVFILPEGTEIEDFCKPDQRRDKKNPAKKQTHDAGIKTEGTYKHALVFQTYTKLDLGGKRKEEAIIFYAGPEEILGIIRNPLWSGRRPLISEPVDRLSGSFFGKSKIEPVKFLQWNLNDFWLMGQDSAMYSLLPIFTVDPLKTPQWSQLTMGLAAIWPVAPADVKQMNAPQLWKDSTQMCDLLKRQIWESLDVNEMMMGRMPAGRKNNQLMGAMQQEQSVNITDHASRYEEHMLNPLVEMMFEFDQQYRTKSLMVQTRGEIGVKAALEEIPVPQWGQRYFFRWTGTEFMNGVQRLQQKIAWMNVLKGIPPQLLNGRTLDVTPILEEGTETIFGPEVAPRILIDQRNQFRVDPDIENEMLHNGLHVMVHEADDDAKHLQSHILAANRAGDPLGMFKEHMMAHYAQLTRKREMAQVQQKGVPGSPGGGQGAAPPQGAAGAPRPGAMPAPGGARPAQQPPGGVPADQIADGAVVGRG